MEMTDKDAEDISTFGMSGVFHSDARLKKFNFGYYKYPFTVSYTLEQTINTTFFLPDWTVRPTGDCAVAHSEFILTYPDQTPVRFKEYLMPSNVVRSQNKTKEENVLAWSVKDVNAIYEQPMSKSDNYEGPTLVLSASQFDLLGHNGNMDSWKDLGMFIYNLNNSLDVLPDDKKAQVRLLTKDVGTTYEKVQALYQYMQQSTRYVAIEYGIAGWQTFDAMNVAKNGYGDCKGLTNYLKALLKEAGVQSYATLVFAGSDDYFKLDETFPSNVFNHVILCVPDQNDTIWVECTSQQLPAGYLGDFTQDRKVLVVTENGGVLCNTPVYDWKRNFISRTTTIALDPGAPSQKVILMNHYAGLMQDDLNYMIKTQPESKIRDVVNSKFAFTSYSVGKYKYSRQGNYKEPVLEETAEVAVSGIMTRTLKRTFLNVGWMNNPMSALSQSNPRTAPLVLTQSFAITDTVIIKLPAGIEVESIPEPVQISYPFAFYKTSFEKKSDEIIFIRNYTQFKGIFKVEDYQNYQKLYNTINSGKNNLNLVFLNKAS